MSYNVLTIRANGATVFNRNLPTLEEAKDIATRDMEQGYGVRADVEHTPTKRLVWSINDHGETYTPKAEG